MLPIIVPIISPNINWNDLVVTINEQIQRSPTRLLKRQAGDLLSYLQFVSSFSTKELNNFDYNQLSFTFLLGITKDEYIEILKTNYLHCVDNINMPDPQLLIICSGTLLQWSHACEYFCTRSHSFRLRYVFDCIALILERQHLIKIKKFTLPDKTFTIEVL